MDEFEDNKNDYNNNQNNNIHNDNTGNFGADIDAVHADGINDVDSGNNINGDNINIAYNKDNSYEKEEKVDLSSQHENIIFKIDELQNSQSDEVSLKSKKLFNKTIKKNLYKKKVKSKFFRRMLIGGASFILGGVILGMGVGLAVPKAIDFFEKENTVVADSSLSDASAMSSKEEVNGESNVIKAVNPSVVAIQATVSGQDMFNMPVEETSAGSGVIFHQTASNVYIVTNSHVLNNASSVGISVENKTVVPAKLVGKNQKTDIAVISVSRESLQKVGVDSVTVAKFGNSDSVTVGDTVIAIGNALGQGNTATMGIVSAFKSDVAMQGTEINVIQTDAAINPGNDGGALIDNKGQVIGINTAKYANTAVEGVGYSISSNIAKPVIEQLMNKTDSPYLGVQVSAVTQEMAQTYGLPQMGVLVQDVVSGSAADKAGIRKNDIITGFNENPILTPTQLTEAVQKCNVGDTVDVKIIRDGQSVQMLTATLLQNTDTSF